MAKVKKAQSQHQNSKNTEKEEQKRNGKGQKRREKTQEQYTILQEKEASQEPGMQRQSSKGLGAKILFDIKMWFMDEVHKAKRYCLIS